MEIVEVMFKEGTKDELLNAVEAEIAAVERRLAEQDLLIIAALQKGCETTELEDEAQALRVALETSRARRRKLRGELLKSTAASRDEQSKAG